MKFDWSIVATMAVCVTLGIAGAYAMHLKGAELAIFIALLALIGIAAAAAIVYFKNRPKQTSAVAPGGAPAAGGDSEIDTLVREADHRLASANAGATIANLPLIFVIGDRSTAKTSTVVNSGIEPELLAGQIYQDNMVAPTRAANVWFSRGMALVEAGGAILADPSKWLSLVKRLRPGKLKSLKGGKQSPRAVLLCVSLESFMQQGAADAIANTARYLQARLAEVAQTLGIRFPVYILFTKTDRVPFFTEFVSTFNNEEASQVLGVTVPIRPAQQTGVYAEDETRRLTGYFDSLFYSLCDKRTVFPPRDNDQEKICGAYEFPREIRKVRDAMVRFMVDICRPSQLTTSPFLRGFYFSGVRPVVVSDAAPLVATRPQQADYQVQGSTGATGMFRVGKQAEMIARQAVAQPVAASRKVPQWMFLGHLFNNVIFADSAAMTASGASVKVSALRRGLLIAASVVCLALAVLFLVSYLGNRSLEKEALAAAQNIPAKDVPAGTVAALPSLQQLENLRQSLEKLDGYETDGAPFRIRWGLYQGSDMHPEVRRLYFARFKALLFGQTQSGLLKVMQGVKPPPAKDADFGYPYNTLKAYLLTTSEYKRASDKSLQDFLGNLLHTRWSDNKEADIGKERMDLAKRQFDYYARILGSGNPYSDKPDAAAVERTRVYLSGFQGVKRVYYGMLADVSKKKKAQSYNQYFEGSATTVASSYPVQFPFTKEGAAYMLDQIHKASFSGEPWVLGPYYTKPTDVPGMQKDIQDLFVQDYIKEWRTVLKTSHVVPYKGLKDAADKLDVLSGSGAPLLELILWTSQNTAVPDLPDVVDAFRVAQTVEPPTATAPVASAKQYNDPLLSLQNAIAKAAEPAADPAVVKAAQDAAQTARQATKTFSSTFPPDRTGGVLDQVVLALLLEPITAAENAFPRPSDELNRAGAGFCGSFGPITKKFPFTRGTTDTDRMRNTVSLQELDDIFKPRQGKLWVLYESVKKIIDCTGGDCKVVEHPPATVNPDFLNFFKQAVHFSRAVYGDAGTEPKWQYTLRPKKADWVGGFEVEVNGESWKTNGDEQKSFVWPGSQKQSFVLKLNLGQPLPVKSFEGSWAVFRFLADANRMTVNGSMYEFLWNFRSGQGGTARPLDYVFDVDTNGAPIFSSELTRCVAQVAR